MSGDTTFISTDPPTKDLRVPVAGKLTKVGSGRTARYMARVGQLEAVGASGREARDGLAGQLSAMADLDTTPAFARDDDGALVVVIPQADGDVEVWRVKDGTARCVGRGEGPAEVAIDRVYHYKRLPSR